MLTFKCVGLWTRSYVPWRAMVVKMTVQGTVYNRLSWLVDLLRLANWPMVSGTQATVARYEVRDCLCALGLASVLLTQSGSASGPMCFYNSGQYCASSCATFAMDTEGENSQWCCGRRATRPVLKHGQRSLTCVRVKGSYETPRRSESEVRVAHLGTLARCVAAR